MNDNSMSCHVGASGYSYLKAPYAIMRFKRLKNTLMTM